MLEEREPLRRARVPGVDVGVSVVGCDVDVVVGDRHHLEAAGAGVAHRALPLPGVVAHEVAEQVGLVRDSGVALIGDAAPLVGREQHRRVAGDGRARARGLFHQVGRRLLAHGDGVVARQEVAHAAQVVLVQVREPHARGVGDLAHGGVRPLQREVAAPDIHGQPQLIGAHHDGVVLPAHAAQLVERVALAREAERVGREGVERAAAPSHLTAELAVDLLAHAVSHEGRLLLVHLKVQRVAAVVVHAARLDGLAQPALVDGAHVVASAL